MKQLAKDKEQIERSYSANLESYEEYHPKKEENYEERVNKFRDENKELRKRLLSYSSADKAQEKNSQQVIDKLYTLKNEEKRYMKAILDSKSSRKKITVDDIKTMDVGQVSSLQREI